jgi:ankyrin repeat protein
MEVHFMVRSLPDKANFEHLRKEAKALQKRARAGDPDAAERLRSAVPGMGDPSTVKLAVVQLAVARSYGFPTWAGLRGYLETVDRYSRSLVDDVCGDEGGTVDQFLRLGCLNYRADGPDRWGAARQMLTEHPELAQASIYAAAVVGDVGYARSVLQGGQNPREASRPGGPYQWEPLLYACYSRLNSAAPGHSTLEVARLLLEAGADPNAGFLWEGNTPPFTALTGAFGYGEDAPNQPPHQFELELATLLLKAGADPNDEQALYNNQWRRGTEHLELLLKHGLGRGDGGPWHRRLAPLLTGPVEMAQDQLLSAAATDDEARAALLVRYGVDLNGRGSPGPGFHGRSAYEVAMANGATRVAQLLAEAGASVSQLDPVDALLGTCMTGDVAKVQEMLAQQPKLLSEAISRDPARIAAAASLGRPGSVRLLARLGFDVNYKQRTTALHNAAWFGDRHMVDLLVGLGADPGVVDDEFQATPAGWARHAHHDQLAEHLSRLEERADNGSERP